MIYSRVSDHHYGSLCFCERFLYGKLTWWRQHWIPPTALTRQGPSRQHYNQKAPCRPTTFRRQRPCHLDRGWCTACRSSRSCQRRVRGWYRNRRFLPKSHPILGCSISNPGLTLVAVQEGWIPWSRLCERSKRQTTNNKHTTMNVSGLVERSQNERIQHYR